VHDDGCPLAGQAQILLGLGRFRLLTAVGDGPLLGFAPPPREVVIALLLLVLLIILITWYCRLRKRVRRGRGERWEREGERVRSEGE